MPGPTGMMKWTCPERLRTQEVLGDLMNLIWCADSCVITTDCSIEMKNISVMMKQFVRVQFSPEKNRELRLAISLVKIVSALSNHDRIFVFISINC